MKILLVAALAVFPAVVFADAPGFADFDSDVTGNSTSSGAWDNDPWVTGLEILAGVCATYETYEVLFAGGNRSAGRIVPPPPAGGGNGPGATPEPKSLLGLGTGIALLAVSRRRRKV